MLKLIIFVILQLVRPIVMIVGGIEINSIAERPFQAALNVNYIPFLEAHCPCGATIISENFVLTAAHCLRNSSDPDHYRVRVGTVKSEWWGTVYELDSLHIHPNHTLVPMRYDLALLKLKESLEFGKRVQPILLPDKNFPKLFEMKVNLTGYGAEVMNGTATDYLKQIELGTIDRNDCSIYVDNLFENQMCAIEFTNKNDTTVCQGDSGGPVTALLGDGRPILIGIISFGNDCRPDRAAVFSYVPAFREWIRNITLV